MEDMEVHPGLTAYQNKMVSYLTDKPFYDDLTSAEFLLPLLAADLMALSPDAGTPNLDLLLSGILPHSPGLLVLGLETSLDETEGWLDLHHGILVVVDKAETGSTATTELCLEADDNDEFLVSLELLGNEVLDLIAGWSSSAWVGKINNKLLTVKELVDNVLTNAHGDLRHLLQRPSVVKTARAVQKAFNQKRSKSLGCGNSPLAGKNVK